MKLTATPPLESSVLDKFWKSFVASGDLSGTLKNYYGPTWGKNLKRKRMFQSCPFNFLKVLQSEVITTASWNGKEEVSQDTHGKALDFMASGKSLLCICLVFQISVYVFYTANSS